MLRENFTQDLYIGLLIGCLFLVLTVRQLFATRFFEFLTFVWNDRYIKLFAQERKKIDIFNGLLFLNFAITTGIFIFHTYLTLNDSSILEDNYLYLVLFCITAIILILKTIVERVIAHFFEFSEFINIYLFLKSAQKNISGLLLLLSNILLLFSSLDKKLIIYSSLIVLLLFNISSFIRFLRLYQKAIFSNIFYFLLYLCALEIAPYVILYKVLKDCFV